MARMRRMSRRRHRATAETTPARGKAEEGMRAGKVDAARCAGAFARVRLVRAWIAAVAAIASMMLPYVPLLEQVVARPVGRVSLESAPGAALHRVLQSRPSTRRT